VEAGDRQALRSPPLCYLAQTLDRRTVLRLSSATFQVIAAPLVFVAQHVADAGNSRSWDLRMMGFPFLRQAPARLENNLNPALNQPARLPIALERV
jgi:hypothetical protein